MYESVFIIFQILIIITNESNSQFSGNLFPLFSFFQKSKRANLICHTKYNSMEALINHFKHYSEGIRPPRGFEYKAVEAPKGEFGVSLITDGSVTPYRCKIRTPAYHHIQVMPRITQGHFFADLITILGSQDIVFGDVDR